MLQGKNAVQCHLCAMQELCSCAQVVASRGRKNYPEYEEKTGDSLIEQATLDCPIKKAIQI
jgi:hypothetical protein